jgi:hypothetical protein
MQKRVPEVFRRLKKKKIYVDTSFKNAELERRRQLQGWQPSR